MSEMVERYARFAIKVVTSPNGAWMNFDDELCVDWWWNMLLTDADRIRATVKRALARQEILDREQRS